MTSKAKTAKAKTVKRAAKQAARQEVQRELVPFRSKEILPSLLPQNLRDDVKGVLAAIAAPKESEPIRFVSEYSIDATAITHPYEVHDASFDQNINEAFCCVFRDPVRSSVELIRTNGDTTYTGRTITNGADSTTFVLAAASPHNVTIQPGETVFPDVSRYEYTTGDPVHGQVLGVGVSTDQPSGATWINSTQNAFTYNVAALVGGTPSMTPVLYRWDGKTFVEGRNAAAITGTGSGAVTIQSDTEYGYYILGFRNSSSAACTSFSTGLGLSFGDGSVVYAHKMLPFLENHFLSIDDVRINAMSLMLTNKAAPINRTGQVAAVQSPGSIPWFNWSFNTIASANNGKVLEAVNGIYIFGKPTMPSDFDYRDPVANDNLLQAKVSFPLDDVRSYIVVSAKVLTQAGQDCYWTRAYGVEFLTSDQWFDRCKPHMNEDIFRQSLTIIRDLEAIHENPLHWKDIVDFGKKAVKGVITYGPTVMSIAKLLAGI